MTTTNKFVREIANTLIKQIKAGTAPWQKGWDCITSIPSFPTNAVTKKPYNGINALILFSVAQAKKYTDNRWVTRTQVRNKHGRIKSGEIGVKCAFFMPTKRKVYDNGELTTKQSLIMNHFVVYNVAQTEGVDWSTSVPNHQWTPIETAETIIANSKAVINHDDRNDAYYSIDKDAIFVPNHEQFKNSIEYYDTIMHELGHWTGHKSRLNRKIANCFGTESYAKEELIAEIASMMIAASIGLSHNTKQHAAYCKSWIKILKDDPREIFKAASAANKIKDYLLKLSK